MATEPQVEFIKRLAAERGITHIDYCELYEASWEETDELIKDLLSANPFFPSGSGVQTEVHTMCTDNQKKLVKQLASELGLDIDSPEVTGDVSKQVSDLITDLIRQKRARKGKKPPTAKKAPGGSNLAMTEWCGNDYGMAAKHIMAVCLARDLPDRGPEFRRLVREQYYELGLVRQELKANAPDVRR